MQEKSCLFWSKLRKQINYIYPRDFQLFSHSALSLSPVWRWDGWSWAGIGMSNTSLPLCPAGKLRNKQFLTKLLRVFMPHPELLWTSSKFHHLFSKWPAEIFGFGAECPESGLVWKGRNSCLEGVSRAHLRWEALLLLHWWLEISWSPGLSLLWCYHVTKCFYVSRKPNCFAFIFSYRKCKFFFPERTCLFLGLVYWHNTKRTETKVTSGWGSWPHELEKPQGHCKWCQPQMDFRVYFASQN